MRIEDALAIYIAAYDTDSQVRFDQDVLSEAEKTIIDTANRAVALRAASRIVVDPPVQR